MQTTYMSRIVHMKLLLFIKQEKNIESTTAKKVSLTRWVAATMVGEFRSIGKTLCCFHSIHHNQISRASSV